MYWGMFSFTQMLDKWKRKTYWWCLYIGYGSVIGIQLYEYLWTSILEKWTDENKKLLYNICATSAFYQSDKSFYLNFSNCNKDIIQFMCKFNFNLVHGAFWLQFGIIWYQQKDLVSGSDHCLYTTDNVPPCNALDVCWFIIFAADSHCICIVSKAVINHY